MPNLDRFSLQELYTQLVLRLLDTSTSHGSDLERVGIAPHFDRAVDSLRSWARGLEENASYFEGAALNIVEGNEERRTIRSALTYAYESAVELTAGFAQADSMAPAQCVERLHEAIRRLNSFSDDVRRGVRPATTTATPKEVQLLETTPSGIRRVAKKIMRPFRRPKDKSPAASPPTGLSNARVEPSQTDSQAMSIMAPDFEEVSSFLVQKIRSRGYRFGKGRKFFIPRSTAREVFRHHPDEVKKLFTSVSNTGASNIDANELYLRLLGVPNDASINDPDEEKDYAERALCDFLASLLWYGHPGSQRWSKFIDLVKIRPGDRLVRDKQLPMASEDIAKAFGVDEEEVHHLYDIQQHLRPVILKKNTANGLGRDAIMPYLADPKPCGSGEGSSGIVFQVQVAKGHLQSDRSVNYEPQFLAVKSIKQSEVAKMTGNMETQINQRFMRSSLVRHGHIARPLLDLFTAEDEHSIFFRLAECDLRGYLQQTPRPESIDGKRKMFQQLIFLASALDYLHHGIQPLEYSHASCHHLDLKPENILVFVEGDAITLKITDFGFSTVHFRRGLGNDSEKLIQSGIPDDDERNQMSDTSLRNQLALSGIGEGNTYMSPEALDMRRQVSSASDVWAFGAIVCTVVAWLGNGQQGVQQFAEARAYHNDSRDYFFRYQDVEDPAREGRYFNKIRNGHGNIQWKAYELNPAVISLFEDTGSLMAEASLEERLMYSELWEWMPSLLTPDPKARTIRMDEVRRKMWGVDKEVQARNAVLVRLRDMMARVIPVSGKETAKYFQNCDDTSNTPESSSR